MSRIKLLPWTILLCAVCSVNARKPCTTPSGHEGDCKSINKCPVLFAIADNTNKTTRDQALLDNSKCKGDRITFCCPIPIPTPKPKRQVPPCYTPDGIRGQCVPFQKCPEILTLMKTDNNFVMDSLCQGAGIVCCGNNPRPKLKHNMGVCTPSAFPRDPASECCGIHVAAPSKIIGGSETSMDEYPWLAILHFQDGKEQCGGSLISSKYVLTAAHCVYDQKPNRPVTVTLGEYNKDSEIDCVYIDNQPDCADTPVTIPIEQVIPHAEFNPTEPNMRHDIALIRLARAAPYTEFIRPICLPSATVDLTLRPPINFRLTAAGWGAADDKHPTTSLKMKVDLPFVNAWECSRLFNTQNKAVDLWSYQLCAGGEKLKDSCTGDSGGPLMYDTNTQHQVIGIVSFGTKGCGTENLPAVYTKVSAYNTWIRRTIRP